MRIIPRSSRHTRLVFAITIALAFAATHVIAQFGSFPSASEGELWGVRQDYAIANTGSPAGVVYLNGTLYVSDQNNGTVVAYDANGVPVSNLGSDWNDNASASIAGLDLVPNELVVATVEIAGQDTDAILISDAVTHRVAALNELGEFLFSLELERPGYEGAVGGMTGLAMGPSAKWVLDAGTLALQGSFVAGWTNEFESDGVVLAYRNLAALASMANNDRFAPIPTAVLHGTEGGILAPHGQLPFGSVFDTDGNLYTIDTNTERVNAYDAAFAHLFTFGTVSTQDEGTDNFNQPYQIAYLPDGNGGRLMIADSDNHRMVVYRPNLANNRLDYLFAIEPFGDVWPRSLALDDTSSRVAVTDLGSDRIRILDTPQLAAFDIKVLPDSGTTVCAGAPYRIQFSLTVPAGRGPVSNVVPTLSIGGDPVTDSPVAEGAYPVPMTMTDGEVATFTYQLTMAADAVGDIIIEAGATASTADVLSREAVMSVAADCSGAPPVITASPSIAPQVSGWTPTADGQFLSVTLAATDDEGVQSIEYQLFGQNDPGGTIPPVTFTAPFQTAQQVTLPLPEFGYTKIRYRASDNGNRWSEWQELELRIQPVLSRLSLEGSTQTFSIGLPIGTGYQFSATGLPPPLTIDPNTGQIGGTLLFTSADNYTVRVTETCIGGPGATCTVGATSWVEFAWVVTNANQPPVVEALTEPFVVDEGAQFVLPITGYDPDGDPSVFTMFGHSVTNPLFVLPQTISIHPVTGVISGYFPFGSDTEYQIFVGLGECTTLEPAPPCYEVLPGERLATLYKFTIGVTPVNQPPFAVTPQPQANGEGDTIALQIVGSDPDNEALTYTAQNLPPGLSINQATGLISGQVGYEAVRTPYVVVIEVNDTDAVSAAYTFDFSWTIADTNRPPTASAADRTDAETDSVSFSITSSDPDGDALSFSATGLPADISIHPTSGVISGTLGYASAATYNVVVTVSDGSLTATAPFVWTVTNTNAPPTITTPGNQTNAEGDSVSVAIAASDVDPQVLTYSASGLPTGLSIDTASGLITGSLGYDTAGPYTVTVTVSDGQLPRSVTFTWTVTNVNRPPVVVNPGTQNSAEGVVVTLPISASDPDLTALTYSATGLPPGLSISPTTGVITGTLSYAAFGTHTVTVTASDGSLSDSETFTWNVSDTNRPPLAVADFVTAVQGQSTIISVLANDSDPDGAATLSVVSVTQPANGTVVLNTNGTVTYSVSAPFLGLTTFTYTVSDGTDSATATVTVDVNPSNRPPVCSAAFSSADLWPPNHRKVYVTISGVTDPDGGTPTIAFTSILQDEPTNSVGQGNTMQDGGIENDGATAWVRAERSGTKKVPGDGRVYLIGFTATDAAGASCTGTIRLDVPHDQRGTPAVLSPGRWDSTTGQLVLPPPVPVANNDTLAASTGSSSTLAVLSNDVSNGESLTVTIVSQPAKGRATVNSNGTITYTPPSNNWTGTTSFTYQVRTPSGGTDTAVVTVTVARSSDDDDNNHDDDDDCGDRNHDHNRDYDNRERDHRRGDHDRCTHGRR